MARSEKDRALYFSGSRVRVGICPSGRFILKFLIQGAFGSVLQGISGREAYGFTLSFCSTGCRSAFHCQGFREILRPFFCRLTQNGCHYRCEAGASS